MRRFLISCVMASLSAIHVAAEDLESDRRAETMYLLGLKYSLGEGVPQDRSDAAKWYRRAAESGHAGAQTSLGTMYKDGSGVPQDYDEALKWLSRAAEQGNPFAQNNLATMYLAGWGVPQNDVLAHKWFNLAAAQGIDTARQGIEELERWMTTEQVAEAQKLAQELFERPQN